MPNPHLAFERLCRLASAERWCWNLCCTTCGHEHWRYALRELSLGRTPDSTGWRTHSRVHGKQLQSLVGAPADVGSAAWDLREQLPVAQLAARGNLRGLQATCRHPDWLGYLGIVLAYTPAAEAAERLLSVAWGPQLREMYPRVIAATQAMADGLLRVGDLAAFEHAAVEPVAAGAGIAKSQEPLE